MASQINPYRDVHKGIRKLLLELLQQIGQTDFGNEESVNNLRDRQIQVFDLLELHNEIEDTLLTPLINACVDAELIANINAAHQQLDKDMKTLTITLDGMNVSADNSALGQQYYLDFSAYVAAQLLHMNDEETKIWPKLSSHCEDTQLVQIQTQARQMLPPAVMQTLLRAMIPAMNHKERELMLGAMQKTLPEDIFIRISSLAQSVLQEKDWHQLNQTLGLQAIA